MTEEQVTTPNEWMLAFMKRGRFTFADLHLHASREIGHNKEFYRLADRLIQRERKAGRIRQVTRNVWELVT